MRKPRVFTRFWCRGAALPRLLFCRFLVLALRKLAENHAFLCVFRVSLTAPRIFCFSHSLLFGFLRIFRNVAKTTRFHAFFEIWPQVLFSLRASGNSFSAFLSSGAAWPGSFWGFRSSKHAQNHAFSHVFIVFGSSQNLFVLVWCFKNVAKNPRFHAFFRPRGRGSMSLFSSFLLALRKRSENMVLNSDLRKLIFGISWA